MLKLNDQHAFDRIIKARAYLVSNHPFFGSLVMALRLVESSAVATMATDGRSLFYNPAFVARKRDDELVFILAHEVYHCALKHHVRRNGRDPELWNKACDYVANADLLKARIGRMPEDALYDPQFAGMNAEQVYAILDVQRQQEQEPQDGDESDDQDGEGEPESGEDGGSDDQSGDDDQAADDDAGGSDAGNEDGEDGNESDDTSNSDEDAEDASQSASSASGDGDVSGDSDESENAGTGEGDEEDTGDATGEANGSGNESDEQTASPPQQSCGDPGGCGEIFDASDDAAEAAQLEAEWEKLTRQALNVEKREREGKLPGHLEGLATALKRPNTNWRDLLRQFVDQSQRFDYTFARPDRRFATAAFILPGTFVDGVNHIAVLIDVSGSVYAEQPQARFRTEIQSMLDDGAVDKITCIFCDTEITHVAEFTSGEEVSFQPQGGGGTSFAPAFAHVNEHLQDASACIYLTDLVCEEFGQEPLCPVLWAVYGDPRYRRVPPFGEQIEIID